MSTRIADRATPSPADRRRRPGGRVLRIVIPALLILVWLVAAGVGGPYFGKVDEVSSNDQTSFLPASADATRVQDRLGDFTSSDALPAVVVMTAERTLTAQDREALTTAVSGLTDVTGVEDGISPLIPAEDGRAAEAFVPIGSSGEVSDVVEQVRERLTEAAPDGVTVHVTGPAGFTADLVGAFAGIDGVLLLVALAAVLVILVIVYRSLLLPVAVLATSMFALCVALLVVWWLAKAGILTLTGQTQGILFILVIGAATDYSLLYTARYREELRSTADKGAATLAAWRSAVEPIAASGGTVIAGLLCLLLSDLNSNKSLGPVAALGIVFAMLAALTLLPALLFAFGRAAYWPRRPVFEPAHEHNAIDPRGLYARVGRLVARRPRAVWIVCVLVLLAGAVGITGLRADGVPQSDLVIGTSDARDGQQALAEHFPGGSGSPASVIVARGDLQKAADTLLANDGVDAVTVTSADSPSGSAPVTERGIGAVGRPGTPAPEPTVADGDVLLQATLTDPADSAAAERTVRALRSDLAGVALIGGETATAIDTNDTSIHDRTLIIPITLAVILVILMLLLRAVVAPVLLILTTVLSFGTALGVSALVFNQVMNLPGADPSVPLFGFVFLVALGIDYNIFLMTRVREESVRHGTRPGILRGLAVTGGVITSAGIVLAATFAALAVIPVLFLLQIAFIVAFGVLLDTFVVRTLLVPALAYDVGPAIWWPHRLSRPAGRHAAVTP
ncbi:membrane protein [Tersicoccus solisilvae]|uniref:Membrane protein n=1 Tax=Tersicoccus solisilvae TaxID=1882339 RepID=A0ABQ1NNU4_9MICC|nr:MMPL family transporter [Tersicoccus solisilvae]GGC79378.1 membrane protein [Tersicoccus solisilvae]